MHITYVHVVHTGLPVVKKYYGKLCSCLPPNYKKTIQKLQKLTDLNEEDVIVILDMTEGQPIDPTAVNQRIIMHLLIKCESHTELLKVCSTLEELVNPVEQLSIHEFHRGKDIRICIIKSPIIRIFPIMYSWTHGIMYNISAL